VPPGQQTIEAGQRYQDTRATTGGAKFGLQPRLIVAADQVDATGQNQGRQRRPDHGEQSPPGGRFVLHGRTHQRDK